MVYNFFSPHIQITWIFSLSHFLLSPKLQITELLVTGTSVILSFFFFFFAVDSTFFSRRVQDQRIRLVNLEL